MNTTETDSGSLVVNAFGLGVGDDWRPFWGSDFFMPAAWTAPGYPGSRPGHAGPGARFCLLGDGIVYASAEFLGVSERAHRWEHRPSPQSDGTMRYEDVGRGWILDLDPNTWVEHGSLCQSSGQSYRYGRFDDGVFTQIRVS
jgi:hypothetical protein